MDWILVCALDWGGWLSLGAVCSASVSLFGYGCVFVGEGGHINCYGGYCIH